MSGGGRCRRSGSHQSHRGHRSPQSPQSSQSFQSTQSHESRTGPRCDASNLCRYAIDQGSISMDMDNRTILRNRLLHFRSCLMISPPELLPNDDCDNLCHAYSIPSTVLRDFPCAGHVFLSRIATAACGSLPSKQAGSSQFQGWS